MIRKPNDVRFSNRPFEVKQFQTIRHCNVDVAHGLALLFGIGTRALPSWDSRTRWNNLSGGLAVSLNGRFKQTCELTSSIVPRGTSFHCWVDLEFSPIGFDPERFSCGCRGWLSGPPELRRHRSQPIGRVISLINPMLRGWVNYFAVGHSSECFSYIKDWVEKKVRRQLAQAQKRKGFCWKRWNRRWLYDTLGLFNAYRVRRDGPKVAPVR